jgi:23S rRNA-/tRNA-specific pseudouridylate synthase
MRFAMGFVLDGNMSESVPHLDVLYESGPCLVLNKPPGLLTQAPAGIDSLEVRVKEFYRKREGKEGNIYVGLPHRLDRPVSGAIVVARHVRAAQRLATQFENRTVSKVYWALVDGAVQPDEGTWTDHLHKRHGMAQTIVVPPDDPRGKLAVLHWRVLGRIAEFGLRISHWGRESSMHDEGPRIDESSRDDPCAFGRGSRPPFTWLEVQLETGRTHQIRVQAASRGHPVLGDAQYGAKQPFGEQFADERLRAIALHARQLGFNHPMTGEAVDVVAPVPAAWVIMGMPDHENLARIWPECDSSSSSPSPPKLS